MPTATGRQVFRDALVEEDNPDWEKYTYLGYNAQGSYHFILRNHYEWSSYILLQQNGRRLDIPSEPIFSPDTSAFVVASASLEYEMMPNSLQFFRRDKEGWRQVAKVEPKMWEPAQVDWLTDTTLLLKQKRSSKDLVHTWFTYAELTIR